MATKLFQLLGADDEASAIVALTERDKVHTALLAEHTALGEKLKAAQGEAAKHVARLAEIEKEKIESAKTVLLDQASTDGRLSPDNRKKAEALNLDLDQLTAFVAMLPPAKPDPKQPTVDTVTLTEEDEALILRHSLDRDKFLAARKAERRPAAR